MRTKNILLVGLVALLVSGLVTSSALTQQQKIEVTVSISNVCSQNVLTIQLIQLSSGTSIDLQTFLPGEQIRPGETKDFTRTLAFTPSRMTIRGLIDETGFSVTFDPLALNATLRDNGEARGCLQVIVKTAGGGTTQPPTGQKPIAEGQSLEQVLGALQGLGVSVSQEGSQANPKFPNVDDPIFLRAIGGFSAQLLFVSSPGTLRSVITWGSPAVDLDLIVIGFGFCFQLNPAGILAETCDRAPFGPVPGAVFAVIIINWSAVPQAYVLSLSS